MVARGFKLYKDDDLYEVTLRDWDSLADLVARGSTREALELVEYLSNGEINAICAMNYARMLGQARAS